MNEIGFRMVIEKPDKMKGALEVAFDAGEVVVKVNQRYMYRLLASKDIVVAATSKTLDDVLQQHLSRMAAKEEGEL